MRSASGRTTYLGSENPDMYGQGSGSNLAAFLNETYCEHCNNSGPWEFYAGYRSETFMFVTEFTYCSIAVICPICERGAKLEFDPLRSKPRLIKRQERLDRQDQARRWLQDILKRVDFARTCAYYDTLGWLTRRQYCGMLKQLELHDMLIRVVYNRGSRPQAET